MSSSVWCFIFARGGSKGLPSKNILPLGGLPLIAHSIKTAKNISRISRIIVSTDSHEIADIAQSYGAEIPFIRPAELATDIATEWSAWQHALNWYKEREEQPDIFLSLPATAPLRRQDDVLKCIDMCDNHSDIVLCSTPSHNNPWFNMVCIDDNQNAHLTNECASYYNRQEVPKTFNITTVAYAAQPDYILKNTHLFSGRVKSVIVDPETAIDIDSELDYKIAKCLYKASNNA